jgi:hypothetical protein
MDAFVHRGEHRDDRHAVQRHRGNEQVQIGSAARPRRQSHPYGAVGRQFTEAAETDRRFQSTKHRGGDKVAGGMSR